MAQGHVSGESPAGPLDRDHAVKPQGAKATVEAPTSRRGSRLGVVCGFLSVAGYTLANLGLRGTAHCDPAWVSAIKAVPTLVIMAAWLAHLKRRGQRLWPDRAGWRWLIVGALAGQFGGNWAFQWSLGVVGLAYAVPLSTGTMILSGGILGRLLLHEPLTPRTLVSLVTLIGATAILSIGAQGSGSQATLPQIPANADPHTVWLVVMCGVAAALFSGFAYAVLGVSIRRTVTRAVPIASVMWVVSLTGVVCMGAVGVIAVGPVGVFELPARDYTLMLMAGLFTTAAFVCLTVALRETSVTYVNCLSAAQVAASSVLGYVLFQEPLSVALAVGVGLTALGLWLLPAQPKPYRSKEP